jgi:hypothetical protein
LGFRISKCRGSKLRLRQYYRYNMSRSRNNTVTVNTVHGDGKLNGDGGWWLTADGDVCDVRCMQYYLLYCYLIAYLDLAKAKELATKLKLKLKFVILYV